MSRVDVTQAAVLTAVVARLRTALSLNERQCFEVLNPIDPPSKLPPSGDYFLSVAPGAGEFETGEQIAGNCTELWEIIVTGYTRMKLDDANRDTHVLHDADRGLFRIKRDILKALVGQDLQDAEGETFLRQWTYVRSAAVPQVSRESSIAWWSIRFGISWDWDLTTDA